MSYKDTSGRLWIRTSKEIHLRARELRKNMTPAEKVLWPQLRYKQVGGLRFRRQHPFGPYIFYFFCNNLKLVIELDGAIHNDPIQRANDAERDEQCRAYGLIVLRFTNSQVFNNLGYIIQSILEVQKSNAQ